MPSNHKEMVEKRRARVTSAVGYGKFVLPPLAGLSAGRVAGSSFTSAANKVIKKALEDKGYSSLEDLATIHPDDAKTVMKRLKIMRAGTAIGVGGLAAGASYGGMKMLHDRLRRR